MPRSSPRRRAEPARRLRRRRTSEAPPGPLAVGSDTALPGAAPVPPPPPPKAGTRTLATIWVLVVLGGAALLVVGLFGSDWLGTDRLGLPAGLRPVDLDSPLLPEIGSVLVGTAYVWALAARTGGRPVVFSLLTAIVGALVLWADRDLMRNGASVMVCVVSAVLAIVATVPAVKLWQAVREVAVASLVAGLGALATVGLHPTIDVVRFEYVTFGLSLVASFGVVYRLGAGLHGLGKRGIVTVAVGGVLLVLSLVYAELLRRYGTPFLVEWLFDAVRWLRGVLGASPRPIVALLGIPALVWGTHMRARRRQGWWVCAFGVGATAPIAQALTDPGMTRQESVAALGYALIVGLALGTVLIRADLALTGKRGRRGRRAEEAAAIRPEPARIEPLL
ncbi:hypothetical protein [Nocardioides sp.]|uniref:hypothetical protein n=1 Tax=Nocardioides sp. TaxID=35761 RepID=UPI002ED4A370